MVGYTVYLLEFPLPLASSGRTFGQVCHTTVVLASRLVQLLVDMALDAARVGIRSAVDGNPPLACADNYIVLHHSRVRVAASSCGVFAWLALELLLYWAVFTLCVCVCALSVLTCVCYLFF